MYSTALVIAQTAFAVVICAVAELSVFYSPVVAVEQPWVCVIPGLLVSTARIRRGNRANCLCSCQLRCCRAVCFTPWF